MVCGKKRDYLFDKSDINYDDSFDIGIFSKFN